MTDEPLDVEPADLPPPRRRKRGVGFWLLVIGLPCLLLVCGGAVGLVWWVIGMVRGLADEQLERVYREALANGDAKAAYEQSDSQLKQAYSREAFDAFAKANPDLFERSGMKAVGVAIIPGYRSVRVQVAGRSDSVEYVCADDGKSLHLLGVTPGLDAAVSADVRAKLRDAGKAKGDRWDD